MAGIKTGIDSKGRRYKTVDGKRVLTGVANAQRHAQRIKDGSSLAGARDAIRRYLKRAVKSGSKTEVKQALQHQLDRKFGLWFKINAVTAAGKSARLYAARQMLQLMRGTGTLKPEDEDLLKKHTTEKSFDSAAFARDAGFTIQDNAGGGGDTSETPQVSDDAKIVAVAHKYKLDSQKLDQVLQKALGEGT